MSDDVLLLLRDIHLPPPISWWPLAWGFWCVAVFLILLTVMIFFIWKNRRKYYLKKSIEKTLQALQSQQDFLLVLQSLSQLLRRTVLLLFPRYEVASLTGNEWLVFLDKTLDKTGRARDFTEGVGRCFASGPYVSSHAYHDAASIPIPALLALVRRWIKAVLKAHPSGFKDKII